jgi:hypothetical protein
MIGISMFCMTRIGAFYDQDWGDITKYECHAISKVAI